MIHAFTWCAQEAFWISLHTERKPILQQNFALADKGEGKSLKQRDHEVAEHLGEKRSTKKEPDSLVQICIPVQKNAYKMEAPTLGYYESVFNQPTNSFSHNNRPDSHLQCDEHFQQQ